MSEIFKTSGKRVALPSDDSGWKFSVRPGGWVIAERAGERRRFMLTEARGKLSLSAGGMLFHGEVVSTRQGASTAGSASDLVAQFPGKVRKVLVAEGATVEEGDPLVLVEAMKMEFSVKAPFKGRVTKVRVQEGQQLAPGDVFVDLEPIVA